MQLNKTTYYRTIAFLLAALVLLTTSSLSIDFHYCQGKLKSFSFFGTAPNCHEIAQNKSACPHHQKSSSDEEACEEEKDCCQNKLVHIQADHIKPIQPSSINYDHVVQTCFSSVLPNTYSAYFFFKKEYPFLKLYKPPLPSWDVQVLYQSFLL